jgi:hypothetical protein
METKELVMARILFLCTILIFMSIYSLEANEVSDKVLYDDFTGQIIDSQKWGPGEMVRKIVNGKLISKISNSVIQNNIRDRTDLINPSSIKAIQCDISINVATLDSGANSQSFARVVGRFYNSRGGGTELGDVASAVYIGDQGNGIEAWWEVWEVHDNGWNKIGSETLRVPGLAYDQSYTVKINYNGTNEFTFTVEGTSDSFTGPKRKGQEYISYKGLSTGVLTEGESGNGYVSASFDNVYINDQGTVYDDFSSSPLDQTRWIQPECERKIENGQLRLTVHSIGEKETTNIEIAKPTPFVEATVAINNESWIGDGARGIVRLSGIFYNTKWDINEDDSYHGHINDVWTAVYIEYFGDGTLSAKCYAEKILDWGWNQWQELFRHQFSLPIVLGRPYTISIHLADTGTELIFTCKDTVTETEDSFSYKINSGVSRPCHNNFIGIESRVYGNGSSGYMAIEVDDVYISGTNEPIIIEGDEEEGGGFGCFIDTLRY